MSDKMNFKIKKKKKLLEKKLDCFVINANPMAK